MEGMKSCRSPSHWAVSAAPCARCTTRAARCATPSRAAPSSCSSAARSTRCGPRRCGDILAQPLPPEEKMARLHGEGSGRRFTASAVHGRRDGIWPTARGPQRLHRARRAAAPPRAGSRFRTARSATAAGIRPCGGGEEGRSREKSAASAAALDQSAQQAG